MSIVKVRCPTCGFENNMESDVGSGVHKLTKVPIDIAISIIHTDVECSLCDTKLRISSPRPLETVTLLATVIK